MGRGRGGGGGRRKAPNAAQSSSRGHAAAEAHEHGGCSCCNHERDPVADYVNVISSRRGLTPDSAMQFAGYFSSVTPEQVHAYFQSRNTNRVLDLRGIAQDFGREQTLAKHQQRMEKHRTSTPHHLDSGVKAAAQHIHRLADKVGLPPHTGPPPESCTPIAVKDMLPDTRHRKRVLRGTCVVDPVHTVSLDTVVEDENGAVVRVVVYMADLGMDRSKESVEERYRRGRHVAIPEPYLCAEINGELAVHVEDPRDFVFVDEVAPSDAAGWRVRGNAHLQEGDLAAAKRCYIRGLRYAAGPDDLVMSTLLNLSAAHLHAGDPARALLAALAGLALRGNASKAHFRAACALEQLGAGPAAQWFCTQTCKLDGSEDPAVSAMLQRLKANGDAARVTSEKAAVVAVLRALAKHSPDCFACEAAGAGGGEDAAGDRIEQMRAAKERGNVSFKDKEYASAIAAYRDALSCAEDAATLLANRALCQCKAEAWVPAAVDACASLVIRPGNGRTQYRLASALMELNLIDEARSAPLDAVDDATRAEVHARREALARAAGFQVSRARGNAMEDLFSFMVPPMSSGESGETLWELQRFNSVLGLITPESLRAAGIKERVPRRDVPDFPRAFGDRCLWPPGCDRRRCDRFLRKAYETEVGISSNLFQLASQGPSQLLDDYATLAQRLGGQASPARKEWLLTAPLGDVRYHTQVDPLAMYPCNNQLHSFGNAYAAPAKLRRGDVHVSVGFNDLAWLAQCLQLGLDPPAAPAGPDAPLLFVGYDGSPYGVAKTSVIVEMLRQGAQYASAADARDARKFIADVVEVWFSSAWTSRTLQRFKAAVARLADDAGWRASQSDKVVAIVLHWAAHPDVPLARALGEWLDTHSHAKHGFGNWVQTKDTFEHAIYAMTGSLNPKGTVGSPVMFSLPDSLALGSFFPDESIFFAIDVAELSARREANMKPAIVSLATEVLADRVRALAEALWSGALQVDLRCGFVDHYRGDQAVVDAIAALRPATMYWSNCPDYMDPSLFGSLARECSAPQGTRHYLHAMNWPTCVKGAFVFDYQDRKARLQIVDKAREQVAKEYAADNRDVYMRLPVVDNPVSVAGYYLDRQFHRTYAKQFFEDADVQAGSWEVTKAPAYNKLAGSYAVFSMAFDARPRDGEA
ncbi:unnamed protein product [Pedinophyceae sp. YPF-701]|nr:unnamed protein product [Pedinophyceae sp. YPF-701]